MWGRSRTSSEEIIVLWQLWILNWWGRDLSFIRIRYLGLRFISRNKKSVISVLSNASVGIRMGDVDKWIEIAKDCKYLPENDLKVKMNMIPNVDLEHWMECDRYLNLYSVMFKSVHIYWGQLDEATYFWTSCTSTPAQWKLAMSHLLL